MNSLAKEKSRLGEVLQSVDIIGSIYSTAVSGHLARRYPGLTLFRDALC